MITGEKIEIREKSPVFRIWLAFFVYTVSVALFVQVVLLPYIFPAWHAGNGLLTGGDWIGFHQLAVEKGQKILEEGWSAWELRPQGQAPAGIASAIYALTVPKPWTVIPFNAALHATAGLVLIRILQFFIPCWKRSTLLVLPFLLYPSAMTWYTMNHKDGFLIAGSFIFLYTFLLLGRAETWSCGWRSPLAIVLLFFAGCILIWVVRPYGVQMLQVFGAVLALLLAGVFFLRGFWQLLPWKTVITVFLLLIVMIVGITPLTKSGIYAEVPAREIYWEKTDWLPSYLENNFYSLARVREGFRLAYPEAGSNIDTDISFKSAGEVMAYLPRAAKIVFLAPFPEQWFGKAALESNTMMRRISAVEMTVVYFSLLFLPYALWLWRRRIETWMVMVFCSGMMILYGLSITNVGTLYRMRYGFLMMLVALGLAGFLEAVKAFADRRRDHLYDKHRVKM